MLSVVRAAGAIVLALVVVVALMIGSNLLLVRFTTAGSAFYLAITLPLAALIHLGGGALGALLARGFRHAVAALVLAGALLMLGSVRQTWAEMPAWYSLAMLVIAPGGLGLGAHLVLAARKPARAA